MCRMTETGFRWLAAIPVPTILGVTWYAYERAPGEYRYSRQKEPSYRPLYAIRVKPKGNRT